MNYIIVSTGRSRSGVLAHYLRQLGCGLPDEYLEPDRFDILEKRSQNELGKLLESKRINGILGMRMVWSHARRLYEYLKIGVKPFVDTYLPDAKYILFTRNPVIQAIEGLVYNAGDSAISKTITEVESVVRPRVANIVTGYLAWDQYFEKYDIIPLCLTSEDLQSNPVSMCKEVHKFLDISYPELTNIAINYDDEWTQHPATKQWYNMCMDIFNRYI